MKFLDSDDPELIACTDGVHVDAGPGYEKYAAAERRFIVLHEVLHVALAHPARGREMERRTEDFDAQLYTSPAPRSLTPLSTESEVFTSPMARLRSGNCSLLLVTGVT